MPRPISDADATPVRVAIITLDSHLASAAERARLRLARDIPGLTLKYHAASEWAADDAALTQCIADIAGADIILCTMMFMEDHFRPILQALRQRRESCDALVCCMSAPEVTHLTRMGKLRMGEKPGAIMSVLRKLRGKGEDKSASAGAKQMRMLRRLPKILRFIPGTAQDLRAYFLCLQYWLAGSDDNIANMIRLLVDRYAEGPRKAIRGKFDVAAPVEYPDVGVYHPALHDRMAEAADLLPSQKAAKGRVGVLLLRSYVLAGNTAHYDGVIWELEAKGLDVVPAFASGLDSRPAIETFFMKDGRPTIDALLSLTGFSLVGGPAYNDARAAEEILTRLDVPYLSTMPVEFQTLEDWEASERGLMPVEATMMVAIPELDGATSPIVFGGRSARGSGGNQHDMSSQEDRTTMLANRIARLVSLRKRPVPDRKVGIVLFNFPPNGGNIGTAAFLGVFESLFNTLKGLSVAGYQVEMPASVDALRERLLGGNAAQTGMPANVHARISAADHVRREAHLQQIEAQWGPAPGRALTDGQSIMVLGERFGNVFVGIQPGFGYEGDPMRLLFEKGFAPTHAFSAFYRWLREDFGADAVLHFGTHGALEFMPGKQVGLSSSCWPDRLIGDLPNVYLYAANNASEGTIAKRRAAATLVSYLTPPLAQAGLYRGLVDVKSSIERWRRLTPEDHSERLALGELIQAQAAGLELADAATPWRPDELEERIGGLGRTILELEYTLIPHGLHVVGAGHSPEEMTETLTAMAEAQGIDPKAVPLQQIIAGEPAGEAFEKLSEAAKHLANDNELPGIMRALDARYIAPAPAGDLIRTPEILPTGRNMHGFDPFRIPSAYAVADGRRQAAMVLDRHASDGHKLPETIALVLWGTDNLKTEGGPIAQALALMGALPRHDSYGRICGAELVPLEALGRPRIDVVMTLSGIFRDLLPLQVKLLAEAAFLAAAADEPAEQNFIRKHTLAYMAEKNCDLETAALRVFSNADGAYGANVNHLVVAGCWNEEDEIAEQYTRRKCFAYGKSGKPIKTPELLASVLADVDLAYQNLDSVELGVTTVDQYFDTLGGISRAVRRAKSQSGKDQNGTPGEELPVYIGDQTRGSGAVRTLGEQVALETRTRMLNPKWYEGMLKHGYEGVRQIEEHVTNTMGWSATTGGVAPWVYQQLTELYVLDPAMRERLAALNTTASARLANRLIEAHERNYWTPDPATLEALRNAGDDLEDRLEGVSTGRAA
jgi:magnesium chelatase subunit H